MQSLAKRQRAQRADAVVGVDAGKYRHVLVVRPRNAADSRPVSFPVTRAGFEYAADAMLKLTADGVGDTAPSAILVGVEVAGSYGATLAHFLRARGFDVVNVLPSDTKRWKEVTHHQALKTDEKDALGITDLVSQGHYVGFAFLDDVYGRLRSHVSTRERFSKQRRSTLLRLKSTLETAFPEFERIFPALHRPTPIALLTAFPGARALRAADIAQVRQIARSASRNHVAESQIDALYSAAQHSIALPAAEEAAEIGIPMMLKQLLLCEQHIAQLERRMRAELQQLPESAFLLSIPGVQQVTAATFLGCVGDVQSYASSRQILCLAGLSLVESSSGVRKGKQRISKRGRPLLRQQAYIFALRSVRTGGIFRERFDAMIARNGGAKIKALTALSRLALRVMFSVARERRSFVASAVAVHAVLFVAVIAH